VVCVSGVSGVCLLCELCVSVDVSPVWCVFVRVCVWAGVCMYVCVSGVCLVILLLCGDHVSQLPHANSTVI